MSTVLESFHDGSIDLEEQITNEMEIIPTIQQYMPYIKVVEPEHILKTIEQNIQVYLKD